MVQGLTRDVISLRRGAAALAGGQLLTWSQLNSFSSCRAQTRPDVEVVRESSRGGQQQGVKR